MHDIATLPFFVNATDDELQWLIDHSYEVELARGDYFSREGEVARHFYVTLEGELQITQTIKGEVMVLGTTPRGIIGGEISLLSGTVVLISAQAIMPSRLLVFDLPAFLGIFTHCPSIGIEILRIGATRLQGVATATKQQEKMAALGKLSAGLAHELNNPAAAAKRSTVTLRALLPSFQARTIRLNSMGLSSGKLEMLIHFLDQVRARRALAKPLSTLEQSDREETMGERLDDYSIENSWDLAATLVAAQISVAEVEELVAPVAAECVPDVITWLSEALTVASLLDEVEQSTQRISDLVGAIKAYTYMDQGTRQAVDIHRDLETTLLMLKHKLKNATIVREYDPALPHLLAHGGELNQVWTNLLDNAIDATKGAGIIHLITRHENNFVMVEVSDNGPGILPENLPRLFEPFFTTKEVGAGTGLGLDITYRIIRQHGGTIQVDSVPGATRFIVRLPLTPQTLPKST